MSSAARKAAPRAPVAPREANDNSAPRPLDRRALARALAEVVLAEVERRRRERP